MNPFTFFWNTSIGKKWLVALTGLVLIGYVIGHMVGNLQIFAGPEQINAYAGLLHSMPNTLWVVRIFLLAAFVLHIVTTIRLVAENRAAKGQKYEQRKSVQAKLATKTMALSGLLVLAFVGLHLADFTIRSTDARYHHLPKGEYDVHTMVIWHFQNPVFTGIYIVAIFLLCMHLSHGFQSLLQTLGANSGKVRLGVSRAGQVLAWLIFLGYISIPVAVMANILKVAP